MYSSQMFLTFFYCIILQFLHDVFRFSQNQIMVMTIFIMRKFLWYAFFYFYEVSGASDSLVSYFMWLPCHCDPTPDKPEKWS